MPPVSSFVTPLVVAGLALAAAGLALRRMPAAARALALVAGTAVAIWGFTLRGESPEPARVPQPRASIAPAPSVAPVEAVVAGTVRLAGGGPIPDRTVVLHRYERTSEVSQTPVQTGSDGGFSFAATAAPAVGFRVTTEYEGTEFGSDLLLPAFRPLEPVELVVAPSTRDATHIRFSVDSTTVVGDEKLAQALHVVTIENTAATAYIGGIRLPVLPGATGFEPREGIDRTRLEISGDEVISGAPVLPGTTEVVYVYTSPVPAAGLRLARTTDYPTRKLSVLTGGMLTTSGLGTTRAVDIEGKPYRRWSRTDVAPGTKIAATIAVSAPRPWLRIGIISLAAFAALIALAVPVIRKRSEP